MINEHQPVADGKVTARSDQHVLAVRRIDSDLKVATGHEKAPLIGANTPGVLRQAHVALRGNYVWAVLLGLVSGGVVGFAAWQLARPYYHSEALLKVAYTLPEVIQETDQNKPLAQFDTFMLSQRTVIGSQRILNNALMDPLWKTTKVTQPRDSVQYFSKNLKVETKPRSEYIQVSVTDYDPITTSTAVNSIINAYVEYWNVAAEATENLRIKALTGKILDATTKIEDLQKKEAFICKDYDTTNLDTFFVQALERVAKSKSALEDVRMLMASASARSTPGSVLSPVTPSSNLTAAQIAMTDATMRGYFLEKERIEKDLRHFEMIGYGDANLKVKTAKEDLEDVKFRIAKYLAFCQEMRSAAGVQALADGKGVPIPLTGRSVEELKEGESRLVTQEAAARKELINLVKARQDIEPLEAKLTAARTELSKLSVRLGVLETEHLLSGNRLSIIGSGETPSSPDKNFRPAIAAAGGLGGAMLPALFFFLRYQLTRRVYHYSDETEADVRSGIPLLGILPVLAENGGNREQSIGAAHSIHQIRVSLNAQNVSGRSAVYLVTSAAPGEGKTSVTMSLALSFAASNARTLVIDGDLIGRRCTQNLEAGELEGLHEALRVGSMNRLVRKTDTGVSILTTGKASVRDACGLGSEKMRALIAQARGNFDVVLIDTGPILGSVEAAVLAQQVDSVIFTVARGQRRTLVEQSLRRLTLLGVRTAGIIFNRAYSSDFESSPYSSSYYSSASALTNHTDSELSRGGSLKRFGPMVKAVASGMPESGIYEIVPDDLKGMVKAVASGMPESAN